MPVSVVPPTIRARTTRLLAAAVATTAAVAVSACSTSSDKSDETPAAAANGGGKVLTVVAAENFWGSIAAQLGGDHVKVTSIIDNPDADPHEYEPTAADGRAVAGADYVVTNGLGYDSWSDKLLAANPAGNRTALKIGDLLGLKDGDNPHQWYSPAGVAKVIDQITADYKEAAPADAGYFDAQHAKFTTETLGPYNKLISDIKADYAGTPIGASESIVSPLADGLGLNVLTPQSFLNATSEGADPTVADKSAIDQQIRGKQIRVYVYNSQNSTPDIAAQVDAAKAAGIPVATVTETPTPANASFQDWQSRQLQGIADALKQATGK
jgi:zinc/manganese transport system substrate-binding protein